MPCAYALAGINAAIPAHNVTAICRLHMIALHPGMSPGWNFSGTFEKGPPSVSKGTGGGQKGPTRYYLAVAYHTIHEEILPDKLASMIPQSGLPKSLFRK